MRKEIDLIGITVGCLEILTKVGRNRIKYRCTKCAEINECVRSHLLSLLRKIEQGYVQYGCRSCSRRLLDNLRYESFPTLTARQMEIINGSLLGDAYLGKSERNGNSYFRKGQRFRVRDYLEWMFNELLPYSSNIFDGVNQCRGKTMPHSSYYTKQHPAFTELRKKWYPQGKKTVPSDAILTPLTVAVWFMDDGCNNPKSKTASFSTQGFQSSECNVLISKLWKLGIDDCLLQFVGNKRQPRIRIRRASYDALMELISPHVIPIISMRYKVDTTRYYGADAIKVEDDEHLQELIQATRQRRSAVMTGKIRTPEHCKNLSEALKARHRKLAK